MITLTGFAQTLPLLVGGNVIRGVRVARGLSVRSFTGDATGDVALITIDPNRMEDGFIPQSKVAGLAGALLVGSTVGAGDVAGANTVPLVTSEGVIRSLVVETNCGPER